MRLSFALWLAGLAQGSETRPAAAGAELRPGPAAVVVRSEAELMAAAARSRAGDLNILVDGRIVVRKTVYFPAGQSVVRLMGAADGAGIHFNMVFDGNWRDPAFRPANGLEFNCRQVFVSGLTFSGFEWHGAAIKAHGAELFDVSRCRFEEIGTRQFPHRVDPPRTADDAFINQCIAAHGLRGGSVSIRDCEFRRCALNNRSWSHCIYASARSVVIAGNRFIECGSALAVGGAVPGASNTIVHNEFLRPRAVPDRRGARRAIYLGDLYEGDFTTFAWNRVSGTYEGPWVGSPDARRHFVDFNDYSEMRYIGAWAANTRTRQYISWEQWRSMGLDGASRPATKTTREAEGSPGR